MNWVPKLCKDWNCAEVNWQNDLMYWSKLILKFADGITQDCTSAISHLELLLVSRRKGGGELWAGLLLLLVNMGQHSTVTTFPDLLDLDSARTPFLSAALCYFQYSEYQITVMICMIICNIYLQPCKNVQKIQKKSNKLQVESNSEIMVCMHSDRD